MIHNDTKYRLAFHPSKIFQKQVTKLSTMEEDRNVESPSKKRSLRSWKSLASRVTNPESMKRTSGSSRDRKEFWQESERKRDDKVGSGGDRQEGKT